MACSGGSSSLAAIRNGVAMDCSFGMSPQSGLPHNNRTGDIDVFAVFQVMKQRGYGVDEVAKILASQSGLAGISGGTDIVSCFALGCPILPVHRGELQCRGLGHGLRRFLDPVLLMRLHYGAAHGYSLLDGLDEFGLQELDPSVVYRALREMEDEGWTTDLKQWALSSLAWTF